jgi:hypothetical protein
VDGLHRRKPIDEDKLSSFESGIEFGAVERHHNANPVMTEGGPIVKATIVIRQALEIFKAEYRGHPFY